MPRIAPRHRQFVPYPPENRQPLYHIRTGLLECLTYVIDYHIVMGGASRLWRKGYAKKLSTRSIPQSVEAQGVLIIEYFGPHHWYVRLLPDLPLCEVRVEL